MLYRKKSYHSMVVPTVLAMTARRSCLRCSASDGAAGIAAVDIFFSSGRGCATGERQRACRPACCQSGIASGENRCRESYWFMPGGGNDGGAVESAGDALLSGSSESAAGIYTNCQSA